MKYLLFVAWTVTLLHVIPATLLGQTSGKEGSLTLNGKPTPVVAALSTLAPQPPPNPLEALRTGKLIYVKSSSLLVGVSVIEEKLQKRREFQLMGLMITRDAAAADLILELHHDLFTMYVYSVIDPKTNVVVAGGKLSSLGGTVAGKVAERFLKQMLQVRQTNRVS